MLDIVALLWAAGATPGHQQSVLTLPHASSGRDQIVVLFMLLRVHVLY